MRCRTWRCVSSHPTRLGSERESREVGGRSRQKPTSKERGRLRFLWGDCCTVLLGIAYRTSPHGWRSTVDHLSKVAKGREPSSGRRLPQKKRIARAVPSKISGYFRHGPLVSLCLEIDPRTHSIAEWIDALLDPTSLAKPTSLATKQRTGTGHRHLGPCDFIAQSKHLITRLKSWPVQQVVC
jgi:hypothetical protein